LEVRRLPATTRESGTRRSAAAFTLIELLVVVGIIVLMVGGIGLAMRGGNGSVALQSAQGTLNSLVSAARGQAALTQGSGFLLVNSDPMSDGFLREIRVAVQPAAGTWSFTGASVFLPAGIYVVPGTTGATGVTFAANWPALRHSDLADSTSIVDSVTAEKGTFFPTKFQFGASGSFSSTSTTTNKLVLSPGRRSSATTLAFDNPELIRGVSLSAYGAPILINNATGFDN
jgi:Tfp pilus assembly protein FimT